MGKFLNWIVGPLLLVALVAPISNAQYSRREVKPPVEETGELDPSTPLGRVQEIAERIETIETTTKEIGRALEEHKVPDYATSIEKILEAAGTTRAEVARLGVIANDVKYIADVVKTIDANTQAAATIADNVATTAKYLRYVPTLEAVDERFGALEKRLVETIEAERAAFAEYREASTADAGALKKKLETASNIIILLGFGILALIAVNVAKWLYDKAQQSRAREAEIQALLNANSSASGKSSK